jgi:RecB family exonuclease
VRTRLGHVVFHGIIDRIDRAVDDAVRVIDYKVGMPRDEYSFQIQFYGWILSRVRETVISEGCVAYLRERPDTVAVDVTREALAGIGSSAEGLEEALGSGAYHASPGVVCETCDFRGMCPSSVA